MPELGRFVEFFRFDDDEFFFEVAPNFLVPQVVGLDDEVFLVFDGMSSTLTMLAPLFVVACVNIHRIRTFAKGTML